MGAGAPSETEALVLDSSRGKLPEKANEIVLT